MVMCFFYGGIMAENKKALCTDIYEEEVKDSIRVLKIFREAWLRNSFNSDSEMFRYADEDFYFYRFAVEREESYRNKLLNGIFYKMLDRYRVDFEVPDNRDKAPFDFIINSKDGRFGYSFEMYYEDERSDVLCNYRVDKAYIIRTVRGKSSKYIEIMIDIKGKTRLLKRLQYRIFLKHILHLRSIVNLTFV